MHQERRLGRRHAIVAPLTGEYADQLLVLGERFQHLADRHRAFLGHALVADQPVQPVHAGRQRLAREEVAHGAGDTHHEVHVAVDSIGFFGKAGFEVVGKLFAPDAKVVAFTTDDDAIVGVVHLRPLQLAIGDHVEDSAQRRVRFVDLADVMHPNIPLVAVALVGVGESAGRVVLLKHADSASEATEQGRIRQPADAGTDDDHVVMLVDALWPITASDSFHEVCSSAV